MKIKNSIEKLFTTGFFHIFSSSILNKILMFCNGIFIVRVLSKENFGVYTYTQNLLSLFLLFSTLGLPNGLLQFGSKGGEKEKINIFRFVIRKGIFINIIIGIMIILYCIFCKFNIIEGKKFLLYMSGIPFLLGIINYFLMFYRIKLKNKEMSIISSFNTIFYVFFAVLGGKFLEVKGLILGQYSAYISTIIIIFLNLGIGKINSYFKKTKISKILKKEIIKYSLSSQINDSIILFIHMIDIFSIGLLIGDKNILASYKVASIIPFGLEFIPNAIMIYIYPYFVKNKDNKEWIIKNYKLILKILGLLNILIVLIMLFLGKYIILKIFGSEYIDIINIFKILCIGYFFTGTFRVLGANILFALEKVKFNIYSSLVACVSNLFLNYFFIKNFGCIGASYSTLLIFIIWSILVNYFIYKTLKNMDGRKNIAKNEYNKS